jgi:ketosteroid isomerase-like protein
MSENLDLVRSIFEAWERGDFGSAEWAAPEFEYVFADGPSPGSWKALAGIAKAWGDFLGAWQDYRHQATEYCELDSERVLVVVHRRGRGESSRLHPVQKDSAGVFHVRDGKVRKLVIYWDRDRALADRGLDAEGEAGDPAE